MKKIILPVAVIIILILVGFWFLFKDTTSKPIPVIDYTPSTGDNTDSTTPPDPKNATFQFEDGDLTLVNGKNQQSIAPDSSIKQDTTLTDIQATGDINGDGKDDSVVILVQSGGGTGVFFYIAGYVSSPLSYKGTNTIFVGDRISPKSISIKNKIITLNYLDRNLEDPLSTDPTISQTKTYTYLNNSLVEIN